MEAHYFAVDGPAYRISTTTDSSRRSASAATATSPSATTVSSSQQSPLDDYTTATSTQSSIKTTTKTFIPINSARSIKRTITRSNNQLERTYSHEPSVRKQRASYLEGTNSSCSTSTVVIKDDIINNKRVTSFLSQSTSATADQRYNSSSEKEQHWGNLNLTCCRAGEQGQRQENTPAAQQEFCTTKKGITNSSSSSPCRKRSNNIFYALSQRLPSQRTMIILVFCLLAPLHLTGYTTQAQGVFFSGGGESGEQQGKRN